MAVVTPVTPVPPVTRKRAWTALLSALVLAVLTGLLLPGPAVAEGTSGESVAHIDAVTEGDGPRTPDIIATSADNAVVAWREGTVPGKVDQGYIRYAYTTDGGASWTHPKVLAQETSEYTWHYVILYQSGNELFAYMGRTKAASDNKNGLPIDAIVVKRSTDEGHTWQDYPVTMPLDLPDTGADEGFANLIIAGRPTKLASGKHVIPFWASNRENGVLISSDLKTWTAGGVVPDPSGLKPGESQVAVSQDDPNKLVMVARSDAAYTRAATATSSDGGLTWTPFTLDNNIPSYNVKVQFIKDSTGRYLSIYNTATNRDVLNYKTKRAGAAWNAGRQFANGSAADEDPDQAGTTGKGWDTYAMADEYAPGKFYVAWEFDTSRIKVNRLDISDAP
ncbi:glycoside hydrolase [Streptomyces cinnabarinus]|uniref:Glycoside hydrolase n=1 Tax=Streptomyces cinnabarinus TaxID=67287 RepID=A0ABY7KA29_9ACTN|nr:sialidase family protein [Streptomyces cinnabarinus]WAZ21376.1 glycoside hydrolase [Streptomyces cinnabarinus]